MIPLDYCTSIYVTLPQLLSRLFVFYFILYSVPSFFSSTGMHPSAFTFLLQFNFSLTWLAIWNWPTQWFRMFDVHDSIEKHEDVRKKKDRNTVLKLCLTNRVLNNEEIFSLLLYHLFLSPLLSSKLRVVLFLSSLHKRPRIYQQMQLLVFLFQKHKFHDCFNIVWYNMSLAILTLVSILQYTKLNSSYHWLDTQQQQQEQLLVIGIVSCTI